RRARGNGQQARMTMFRSTRSWLELGQHGDKSIISLGVTDADPQAMAESIATHRPDDDRVLTEPGFDSRGTLHAAEVDQQEIRPRWPDPQAEPLQSVGKPFAFALVERNDIVEMRAVIQRRLRSGECGTVDIERL